MYINSTAPCTSLSFPTQHSSLKPFKWESRFKCYLEKQRFFLIFFHRTLPILWADIRKLQLIWANALCSHPIWSPYPSPWSLSSPSTLVYLLAGPLDKLCKDKQPMANIRRRGCQWQRTENPVTPVTTVTTSTAKSPRRRRQQLGSLFNRLPNLFWQKQRRLSIPVDCRQFASFFLPPFSSILSTAS